MKKTSNLLYLKTVMVNNFQNLLISIRSKFKKKKKKQILRIIYHKKWCEH